MAIRATAAASAVGATLATHARVITVRMEGVDTMFRSTVARGPQPRSGAVDVRAAIIVGA
jgi:hypothetical protein